MTTVAQYKAGTGRARPNLFSHSDQQNAWMGLMPGQSVRTGWGGRAADKLELAANAGASIPATVSVSGKQVFTIGNKTAPFVIPRQRRRVGVGAGRPMRCRRRATPRCSRCSSTGSDNEVVDGAAAVMNQALAANATANPILQATLPPVIQTRSRSNGTLLNTGIAQQLRQVARLIERARHAGIDAAVLLRQHRRLRHALEHGHQPDQPVQPARAAMKAFYDYTVAAGVANMVTQFTMSDFNRTFIGNGNAGVDHAYGAATTSCSAAR